jgi:hypothetical protein
VAGIEREWRLIEESWSSCEGNIIEPSRSLTVNVPPLDTINQNLSLPPDSEEDQRFPSLDLVSQRSP